MSSNPKRNGSTEEVLVGNSPDEEIRRRAYEMYLERGEQQGRELDDWLQAERELEERRAREALSRLPGLADHFEKEAQ